VFEEGMGVIISYGMFFFVVKGVIMKMDIKLNEIKEEGVGCENNSMVLEFE
jgi:hypothetical protein